MGRLRAPAVPLLLNDPYLSIWSFADKLYEEPTRHWTGTKNSMLGFVKYDDKTFRFMGKTAAESNYHYTDIDVLLQKSVEIKPTSTKYIFENEDIELEVEFLSPLITDDLQLLSRPVSYISYKVTPKSKAIEAKIYFDIACEACVDKPSQSVRLFRGENGVYCGNIQQNVLGKCGDDLRIDWGYLHLLEKEAYFGRALQCRDAFIRDYEAELLEENVTYEISEFNAVLAVVKSGHSGVIAVAYDDIKSIEYFGEPLDAYYKINGDTFDDMCKKALEEYVEIKEKCDKFDEQLIKKAKKISREYKDIISLTYRQTIAAHKLCFDEKGMLFISKECYSNGCIGTVDVTYPSIPMFLIFNPDLVEGMLNPVFEFAEGNHGWNFDFAPHDVGQYPLANGQVYGYLKEEDKFDPDMQMPVEECGNMLLCVYASCLKKKNFKYAGEHYSTLKKWADYLVSVGFDPESQLCTDDFAGHLAHNCNLSVKGILGIASFGKIAEKLGENGSGYAQTASEYAAKWKMEAFSGDHYALAFDKKDTWSLKYNLALDKVLKLNVFDEDIFKTEVEYYKTKFNEYGLPLDCREDYTKSDWLMWSVCLSEDMKYREMIIGSMWKFLNSCKNRVPFGDWYYTSKPVARRFQGRSVQGGLFLPIVEI